MQIAPYVSDRRRRRKKIKKYVLIAVGIFAAYFVLFGIFWAIARSPLFRVQHIVVTGNNVVPSADIVTLLQANPSGKPHFWGSLLGWGNMFAWPDALPAANLNMIPELASATVSKDYFSHTITVAVTERAPFGIWCFIPKGSFAASAMTATSTGSTSTAAFIPDMGNEQCYWFDDTGVLFEKSLSTQGNLIFVVNDYSQADRGLGETVLPPEFNGNFISIMDVLHEAGLGIKEMDLRDISLEEIDAATTEGPDIYFSLRFPATDYLAVLQSLIAQSGFDKLHYVDCRTEDRVYYK